MLSTWYEYMIESETLATKDRPKMSSRWGVRENNANDLKYYEQKHLING
jgi:hypothetical protein